MCANPWKCVIATRFELVNLLSRQSFWKCLKIYVNDDYAKHTYDDLKIAIRRLGNNCDRSGINAIGFILMETDDGYQTTLWEPLVLTAESWTNTSVVCFQDKFRASTFCLLQCYGEIGDLTKDVITFLVIYLLWGK